MADGLKVFWRWTRFTDYAQFMILFTLIVGAVTYIFAVLFPIAAYPNIIGTLSVAFEACFAFPQILRIWSQKSAVGIRWEMVATWLLGDGLKTAYYILLAVPVQFLVCGILQMCLDLTVAILMVVFRKRKAPLRSDSPVMM